MDIDEFLATEAMGYMRHQASDWREYWTLYLNRADCIRIPISDWSPTSNIEQAIMCLDAFMESAQHHYKIQSVPANGNVCVHLWGHLPQGVTEAYGKSLSEAVSLACARAQGWRGE